MPQALNLADGLVGLLLVIGAWQGFRRGFVASLYGFAALAVELIVAGWLKAPIAALVSPYVPLPEDAIEPLAFLAALGAIGVVLGLLGGVVVGAIRLVLYRLPLMRAADRVIGVVPGIAQYALVAASLIVILQLFTSPESALGADLRSSSLTPLVDFVGRLVTDRIDIGGGLPQSR